MALLVFLDVSSLFLNVSVKKIIAIILENVYHHQSLKPTNLQKTLKQLLLICKTKKPFKFTFDTFLQRDGVTMGSPLDLTFNDICMACSI